MESLVRAYHWQYMPPLHHYRGPSNLQTPISPFTISSPHPSSSSVMPADPYHLNPNNKPGFGHCIIPTVAVAASAWLFVRLHRYPPIITVPVDLQLESEEEEGTIKKLPLKHKPNYVQALHLCRIKKGMVVKLIDVYESNDYESLKARIRSSTEWLESARKELGEVIQRDPGRVMEYSQVVDELMEILKDMEVYVEKCEKDRVKGYLRSCNRLLDRVRKMEVQIFDLLKEFQDKDEEEEEGEN